MATPRPRTLLANLAVLVAAPASAQVRPGGTGFGGGSRPPAEDDAFLFHVLRRTSYGPTSATLAEIRALVEGLLAGQLEQHRRQAEEDDQTEDPDPAHDGSWRSRSIWRRKTSSVTAPTCFARMRPCRSRKNVSGTP